MLKQKQPSSQPHIALLQSLFPRSSTFAPLGPALYKKMSIMLAEQRKTGKKGLRLSCQLICTDDFIFTMRQTQDEFSIRFILDV